MLRFVEILTVREVADEVGINVGSCHQTSSDKLEMRCVGVKFMLHLLIDDQKQTSVEIRQELPATANVKHSLNNIITGDETWVYGCDIQIKVQSSQWVGKGSPRPKKAFTSRSRIKMLVVLL